MSPWLHRVAVLVAGPLLGVSAGAASLDASMNGLVDALRQRDGAAMMSAAEDFATRLIELRRVAGLGSALPQGVLGELDRALAVISAEPLTYGELVASIESDTRRLETGMPPAAALDNPVPSSLHGPLRSDVPSTRAGALDRVRQLNAENERRLRKHEADLTEGRRTRAAEYESALSAQRAGVRVQQLLEDLNETDAAPALNAFGGQLVSALLDVTLFVNPALTQRTAAALAHLRRYDSALDSAQRMLDMTSRLEEWAGFYRWQDWAREQPRRAALLSDSETSSLSKASADVSAAAADGASILEFARQRGPEPDLVALREKTLAESTATEQQVNTLLRQARERRQSEAALQEFRTLLAFSSAFTGLGAQIRGDSAEHAAIVPRANSSSVPVNRPPLIIRKTWTFEMWGSPSTPEQRPR